MSEGESATPIVTPGERVERDERRTTEDSLPWFGLAGSALVHGFFALILVWGFPELPSEPEIVPVRLVFVPPPAPPPPPPPAPDLPAVPPPPPADSFTYRQSGPGERTVAPPLAEAIAPEAAAPPPSPAPTTPPEDEPLPAPPPEKPLTPEEAKPPKAKREAHLAPQQREAETLRAPRLAPRSLQLHISPGEKVETGDPYLNQLYTLIERHRVYPRVIGAMGLPVEGTATFQVVLDRSGRLLGMRLARSSGAAGIDEAAATMIRQAFPAPPPPSNYPDPLPIVVAIRLFPPS